MEKEEIVKRLDGLKGMTLKSAMKIVNEMKWSLNLVGITVETKDGTMIYIPFPTRDKRYLIDLTLTCRRGIVEKVEYEIHEYSFDEFMKRLAKISALT
jgi:hypothetical protein